MEICRNCRNETIKTYKKYCLLQAESKLRGIEDLAIKAYRKYLEITDPKYLSELTEAE